MESSRARSAADQTGSDSVFFYIPGTAILNPTFETILSKMLAILSKKTASLVLPEMFTSGATLECIKFDDPRLPKACKNLKKYYEKVTKSDRNRVYVQWNGDLGQTAWIKTARFMEAEIYKRLSQLHGDTPLTVHVFAHSHGGQIARYLAESFKGDRRVRFHITTIETPLSVIPPLLMPDENVATWQHFYHRDDKMMRYGSFIMQSENLMGDKFLTSPPEVLIAFISLVEQWLSSHYVSRIEDVFDRENLVQELRDIGEYYESYKKELPSGWQSHELLQKAIKDFHNDPVRLLEVAEHICKISLEAYEAAAKPDQAARLTPQ